MNQPDNKDNPEGLSPKEMYDAKKRDRQNAKKTQQIKKDVAKKGKKTLLWGIVAFLLVFGSYYGIKELSSLPSMPTTSSQNHTETVPASHILTTPIPPREQSHMLEHSDGDGLPGVIIQYNCDKYDCAPDLIDRLSSLVEEYPESVYLAPNKYDGKIILTKVGQSKTIDEFDEEAIRQFIGREPKGPSEEDK